MDTDRTEGTMRYSVQVEGIEEAHADTLPEAVLVAGYLQDVNARGSVQIVDHGTETLILGWRLMHPVRKAGAR